MTELNDGATSVNSLSVDRTDVTEQVLRRIKELLISGELAASSRFSSEPVLAEWLEVSRLFAAVRSEASLGDGVIRARPGSGTCLAESIPELFTEPMHVLTLINQTSAAELVEARGIIEEVASGFRVGWGEKMDDPLDPPVMQDKEPYEKLLGLSAPWSAPLTNIARESGDTLRRLRRSRREPVGIEIGQDFEP